MSISPPVGSTVAATASQEGAATTAWLRFLSRWSLLAGLVVLGTFPAFFFGVVVASQPSPLPPAYAELVAASRNPALYRMFVTFDALTWLVLSGFFLSLAALLARHAPIRSTLLAACGTGLVVGLLGAFLRLSGTTALAAQYGSADPAQQALLRLSYLDLVWTFTAAFSVGQLLWASALVLGAWSAWSMPVFPRWLLCLMALAGTSALMQNVFQLVTSTDLGFLIIPELLVFIVVFFAVAGACWRRTPPRAPIWQTANERVQ
jgi:hypothetical protein